MAGLVLFLMAEGGGKRRALAAPFFDLHLACGEERLEHRYRTLELNVPYLHREVDRIPILLATKASA